MTTKAEARRYRDDLLDCTGYLCNYLNNTASFWQYSCFDNIGYKAEQINNYIVDNNDIETAFVIAKIDRSLWHRIAGVCDYIETNEGKRLFREFATVSKELFEVQNWYLETVYNIPVEALRNCEYYVCPNTGEVKNSSTQEVLQNPIPQRETAPQQQENPQAGNCEAKHVETPQKPQNGQRGRKAKPFACYLLGDEAQKAATLKALHTLLQGKSGKDVVLILRAAVEAGKITKPTFTPVKNEFGDIGSESGYNRYMNNERAFSNKEIQGAITALKEQLMC